MRWRHIRCFNICDMRNLQLVLTLGLSLTACTVGDASDPGGGGGADDEHMGGGGSGSGSGSGEGEGIAGDITADATWTGTTRIKGATTIKPGVTVTVEAGTTLNFAGTAGLLVEGTLTVAGTSAAQVNLVPETGSFWSGIEVAGTYNLTYGIQRGGAIRTRGAGTVTAVDSKMWGASGDFIIAGGGTITIDHSNVGAEPGTTDTTHCQLHFNSGVGAIKITNSNINRRRRTA